MTKGNKISIQLIERYLSFLKNLSTEDCEKVDRNILTIKFDLIPAAKKTKTIKETDRFVEKEPINVDIVIEKLYSINSRHEGESFLESKCSNRSDWEKIARQLDVPFQKKDNIDKLKEKIIERTIGFRLRSQAIQGDIQ